jgi:hypothetical protein
MSFRMRVGGMLAVKFRKKSSHGIQPQKWRGGVRKLRLQESKPN